MIHGDCKTFPRAVHNNPNVYQEDTYTSHKDTTINCIPSKMKLVPGDGNQRLLQAVTLESKVRGQDGKQGGQDADGKR